MRQQSILVALKDSKTARSVVQYFAGLPFQADSLDITLLHVFRQQPTSGEETMGEDFLRKDALRARNVLEDARKILVEGGIDPENIHILLDKNPYPTATDGIIDHFSRNVYDMVVIGRRKKSKSEEFVLGDVSIKLVRALEGAAVLVVKTI